jgi:hypothetical protein
VRTKYWLLGPKANVTSETGRAGAGVGIRGFLSGGVVDVGGVASCELGRVGGVVSCSLGGVGGF